MKVIGNFFKNIWHCEVGYGAKGYGGIGLLPASVS